jgi:hypothetical protein
MAKNTPQNTSKDVEMTEITNIETWQKRLFNGDGTLKPDKNNLYEAFNRFMLNGFMNAKPSTDDLEYFLEHFKFEVLIKIVGSLYATIYIQKANAKLSKEIDLEVLKSIYIHLNSISYQDNQENEQLRIDLLRMINESIGNNSDGASVNAQQTIGSIDMSRDSNSNNDNNSVYSFYYDLNDEEKLDEISVSGGSSDDTDDNSYPSFHSHLSSKFSVTNSSSSSEQIGKSAGLDTEYSEDFENYSVFSDVTTYSEDELELTEIEKLEQYYNLNTLATPFSQDFLHNFWKFVIDNIQDKNFASKFLELHSLAKLREYFNESDATYLYFIANMSLILDSNDQQLAARKQNLEGISQDNLSTIEKTIIDSLINIVDGLLKSQSIFNILDTLINSSKEFANFFVREDIGKWLYQINSNTDMDVIQLNLNAHNQYRTDESRQLINDDLGYLSNLSDDTLPQTIIETKSQLISSLTAAITSNLKDDANDDESTIHTEYSQNDNSPVGKGQNSKVYAQISSGVDSHIDHNTHEETLENILRKLNTLRTNVTTTNSASNLNNEQEKSLITLLNELSTLTGGSSGNSTDEYKANRKKALSILSGLGNVTVSGHENGNLSQSLDNRIKELSPIVDPHDSQLNNSSNVGAPNTRSRLNSFSSTNNQDSSPSDQNSLDSQNSKSNANSGTISNTLLRTRSKSLSDINTTLSSNSLVKGSQDDLQLHPSDLNSQNSNANSNAYSGSFSDPKAHYDLNRFFSEPESTTQEITLYASTTQISGDPDLNPVNVSKTDNVTISTNPISVYAPSSGQEYSLSLKEKGNASSGGGGDPYNFDDLISKTYHHASLKISSITNDDQNQKLALTIMNMIENIVSSSQNLKIRTENPLAAAIADVYYNDYLKESGVVCSKYKNPKFTELENNGSIRAKAAGILEGLISKQFSSTADPKQQFITDLASCPWHVAALQVRNDLTNTNSNRNGPS